MLDMFLWIFQENSPCHNGYTRPVTWRFSALLFLKNCCSFIPIYLPGVLTLRKIRWWILWLLWLLQLILCSPMAKANDEVTWEELVQLVESSGLQTRFLRKFLGPQRLVLPVSEIHGRRSGYTQQHSVDHGILFIRLCCISVVATAGAKVNRRL